MNKQGCKAGFPLWRSGFIAGKTDLPAINLDLWFVPTKFLASEALPKAPQNMKIDWTGRQPRGYNA